MKANGFAQFSDQDTIDKLVDMSVMDRQQFMKTDLTTVRPRLTREDYNMLRNEQSAARSGSDKSDLGWLRNRNQTVDDVMLQSGIVKNEAIGGEFRESASLAWNQFLDQNKRRPSENEWRTIVNGLATNVALKDTGIFFDDESKVFQIKIDDIPGKQKNQIELAYQRAGFVHESDPNPQGLPTYDDDDLVSVFVALMIVTGKQIQKPNHQF